MTKDDKKFYATTPPHPSLSSSFINIMNRMLPDFGINPDQLFFEMDQEILKNPAIRFPLPFIDYLTCKLQASINDPDIGLLFGERFEISMDLLNFIVFNSPSFQKAMQNLSRYYTLFQDVCTPQFSTSEGAAKLTLKIADGVTEYRIMADGYLVYYHKLCERLIGKKIRLIQVDFAYPRPENINEHSRIFDTDNHFDQEENAFHFDVKYLDHPVRAANPELLAQLELHAKNILDKICHEDTFASHVEKAILTALPKGNIDIDSISSDLGLTTRNLQNKLKKEGTRYQKLLESAKKRQAKYLLSQAHMSILDITFVLGYSEQSTFSRAFKKWTGLSPGDYRLKNSG